MKISHLILAEATGERRSLMLAASLAGVANSLIMYLVGTLMQAPGSANLRLVFLFILAIAMYAFGAHRTYNRVGDLVEAILYRLRLRIVGKLQRVELQGIERLGTMEIYTRITESMTYVSMGLMVFSHIMQSLVIVAAAMVYLAWLSSGVFMALTLLLISGLGLYGAGLESARGPLKQLAQSRITFLDALSDLLRGIKEVRHSRRRNQELGADIASEAEAIRKWSIRANHVTDNNWIFVNCALYVVLGALVLVLPQSLNLNSEALGKVVPAILFIWGPLVGTIRSYPVYLRANQALHEIDALEAKLDLAIRDESVRDRTEPAWQGPLTSIEAHDIQYQYPDDRGGTGFRIGPLSLTIAGGQIVFIVGGSGSGKSTLLKALMGLYDPTAGTLRVNGVVVQPDNVAAYRELSSTIYSDFHLFKKVYGLLDVEESAILRLLAEMQLDGKTSFRNHGFTNRDLSTGQRKRLAMIVALLEDRPLYVLDEWAADQDPEFRHHFYMEMLPALKKRGKTVIAACHDDRYFHCADQVVKMEYGQIRSISYHADPSGSLPPDEVTCTT